MAITVAILAQARIHALPRLASPRRAPPKMWPAARRRHSRSASASARNGAAAPAAAAGQGAANAGRAGNGWVERANARGNAGGNARGNAGGNARGNAGGNAGGNARGNAAALPAAQANGKTFRTFFPGRCRNENCSRFNSATCDFIHEHVDGADAAANTLARARARKNNRGALEAARRICMNSTQSVKDHAEALVSELKEALRVAEMELEQITQLHAYNESFTEEKMDELTAAVSVQGNDDAIQALLAAP